MDSTCLSSLLSMASYAREPCGNPRSCNFTSRSVARPRQSLVMVARGAERLEKIATLPRVPASTTPIPGNGCAWRRHVGKNVQLYLAFLPSTTSIHGKGCASRRKMCNFTSRSCVRPRQSIVIFDTWRRTVGKTCNFTSRSCFDHAMIHGKGCEWRRHVGKMCNFTSRSCVRPRQFMGRVARHADMLEKCATLPRVRAFDHANPWEGLRVTPTCWKNMQLYLAFVRSTTPIHGKGCASRRHVGKLCNFTLRSCVRPRQSMGRVARHADMLEKCATLPRVRAFDHANPWERLHVTPTCWKNVQLYLAFVRSTTPIHGTGCAWRFENVILRCVRALDHANPW